MIELTDLILLAGAIAWLSTAIVAKTGPFSILLRFRHTMNRILGGNSPFTCFFCTSFWVGLLVIASYVSGDTAVKALIQFFGVLGVAMALRGASNEWSS